MGCGIACVAYVLRKKYDDTKANYFDRGRVWDADRRGLTRRALLRALRNADIHVVEHRFRAAWQLSRPKRAAWIRECTDKRNHAIVLVERYPGDKYWHYIVYDRGRWIDPLDADRAIPSVAGQVRVALPAQWKPLGFLVCRR
jgi:hypothetical protein